MRAGLVAWEDGRGKVCSVESCKRGVDIRPAFNRNKQRDDGRSIMPWSRAFHVPITTPDGLMLRTLRDAGEYMQALPRAKLKQPEWQIAAEMVLAAVEGSGPLMFAEIAMRKAVNAGKPAPEPTPRGKAVKK